MKALKIYRLRARQRPVDIGGLKTCMIFLSIFFVAGALAGSVIGSASFDGGLSFDVEAYAGEVVGRSYWMCFWLSARFAVVAFFMGLTLFGFVAVPLVVLLHGYTLSCTVASIISCADHHGFIMAVLLAGISAIVSVPCMFAVSTEAVKASRGLVRMYLRGGARESLTPLAGRFIAALLITAAFSLVELYLVPLLVSLY